jgi:hypothetical protein
MNIPEGEEKWDCNAQIAGTQDSTPSVPPNGMQHKINKSEQSNIEGDDQTNCESEKID